MAQPHPRGERRQCAEGGARLAQAQCRHCLSRAGDAEMKARLLTGLAFALLALTPAARAADIKSVDLGKNVEAWFSEDHTVPIIAFNISLPAGSGYDPAGKAGLAAFAADLIDEGAGNMDSRAFHGALADHAIQFRASADRDNLIISIVTLSENAPLAMHLLQTALTHPRFDAESVTRVRAQVIQGIQQGNTRPPTLARRVFSKDFFNGHVYGQPSDGDIRSV